ncbi:TAXI family TRAP transporter solute-binding subunit [Solihabitans fulvus]|uniref:TAXI family TRAP transporter solute-binding subunit n=1 Tax=Solihabitans fulvus TaxID=1892852 RepID=A0A5B2X6Q3_9PSEU|nr:TAXI family TRAP transporter solute-binding subunit [Solihabitans fulvus]
MSRRAVLLGAAAAALSGCTLGRQPGPAELVLATGPEGAVFREIGAALADALARHLPDTRVRARPSSASVQNQQLLVSGAVQLALSSLDAVLNTDNSSPDPGIRAVARLYDSFLHLVVPAGSPIRALADLAGRTVSLGATGSGTEFTGTRLLRLLGVQVNGVRLNQADSSAALEAGRIEAFLTLTGIPTPAITGLLDRFPVRLVPLSHEAETLAGAVSGPYLPATIPTTTYGDLPPCPTVAVPNLLLVRADLPDDVVEVVTGTVFTESARIAAGHPEASRINVRTGIATGPVPLHPGAQRWFRNAKR